MNKVAAPFTSLRFVRASAMIIALILMTPLQAQVDVKPSCENLRANMRSLQTSQFQLKDGDKTLFELTQEHDALIAELAIIEGIRNLKNDFENHRRSIMNGPLTSLKESIAKLDEGRLTAGKMAALESFIDQLKKSPDLPAVINELKANEGRDPSSEEVIMSLATKECSAAGSIPLFCTILNQEEERASGLIKAATSLISGSERRPIRRTLEEFAKTYQVMGANIESTERSTLKLTEFEQMLGADLGIDANAYHGQMEDILSVVRGQSQMLAIDVRNYERCSAEANARGDRAAAAACQFTSNQTKAGNQMVIDLINQKLAAPELAAKYRISLAKLKKDIEAVGASRQVVESSREKAFGDSQESKAAYNQIAKSAFDKISYIYSTLKKRNISGRLEDYFKNEDKGGNAQQIAFDNFSHFMSEVSPRCSNVVSSTQSFELLTQKGAELSSCLNSLSANEDARLQAKSDEIKARVAAAKARMDKVKSTQEYANFEKLKTFTARSYVSGDDCTSAGGRTEYISSCEGQTGIDLGFNTISRLTDSAGQILVEFQAGEIGKVETREGARTYSQELMDVCNSDHMRKSPPQICNSVRIYHEAAHIPTKTERYQEKFRTKNIVYDLREKRHVVTNKQPVITHPIVLEAATKNILSVGGAFIQGRNAYDASLIDGTNRLNMAWSNYYLNQYYYYNAPFFTGGYSLGGYPFALTSASSIPDTSLYYSIQ